MLDKHMQNSNIHKTVQNTFFPSIPRYSQEIDLHMQDSALHSGTAKGVRTENYLRGI